eukprot:4084424-Amphidinium_carterae.1
MPAITGLPVENFAERSVLKNLAKVTFAHGGALQRAVTVRTCMHQEWSVQQCGYSESCTIPTIFDYWPGKSYLNRF